MYKLNEYIFKSMELRMRAQEEKVCTQLKKKKKYALYGYCKY